MTWTTGLVTVALAALALCAAESAEAAVTAWPAPAGEPIYDGYTVRVNGKAVPVHACRVSAVPLNQVWPGYQRPMDQTELAGFAHWGQMGPVTVEVTATRPFRSVVVRPLSRKIVPKVSGRRIAFTLDKPGQLTVELDGPHHALHLFADPPDARAPKPGDANVKLVGLWRYNADGIDLCNTQDAVVRNCFVRAFDDAIVLKGLRWDGGYHERPVQNIRVHDCVVWCDWGRGLEIGAETSAPEFADILFKNCDIIRTTHIAMDAQCGDRALVHDVRYEDIRVETDEVCPSPKMQQTRDEKYVENPNDTYVPNLLVIVIAGNPYSRDTERGRVRNITFRNISLTGKRIPKSWFRGFDADHDVRGVSIENLRFNGKPARSVEDAGLSVGQYVGGVTVR